MISAAARKYLGVRFRHRGRSASGMDCVGLGLAAYADCGVVLPDYRLYGREPHRDGLLRYVTAAMGDPVCVAPVPLSALRVDDVLVMRFDHEPHHVGIVGSHMYGRVQALTLIHACGWHGRVLEQRLTPDMIERITHVFRRPV